MTRTSSEGFTLVELAISLMVIGLLIGGVLKGQELIKNAQITATVRQLKSYETALEVFRDTYETLPGDMRNPGLRLANCTDRCAVGGNADKMIGPGNAVNHFNPPSGGITFLNTHVEVKQFWMQLQTAGYINNAVSLDPPATFKFGQHFPVSNMSDSAGFFVIWVNGMATARHTARYGNMFILSGSKNGTPAITAREAQLFDQKIDDGKPYQGSVFADNNTTCTTGATPDADYNVISKTARCDVFIPVQ